ncbi:hypothetical protein KR009_002920 [Drosophila setifemur]|nr:hypothetical protein KR009_002920 [Drosophila setifemur]
MNNIPQHSYNLEDLSDIYSPELELDFPPLTHAQARFEETVRSVHMARQMSGLETAGGRDEYQVIALAREREREQKAMDRFLNTTLVRDQLPPDTPLKLYLTYREPRSVSPTSRWDGPGYVRYCHHYHINRTM